MIVAAMACHPEWRADVHHDDRGIGHRRTCHGRPLVARATALPMAAACRYSNRPHIIRTRTALRVPLPFPIGRRPGANSLKGDPHANRPCPPR
jgi:hypothetical protein